MGVTFSYGAYEGSYSGFDELRKRVFAWAGYGDLETVEGFTEPVDQDDPDGPTQPGRNLRTLVKKSDPIYPLIDADDTEGSLRNAALPPLAKRLRQLVNDHPVEAAEPVAIDMETGVLLGPVGLTWGETILQFAEGCEAAHAARADLTWE